MGRRKIEIKAIKDDRNRSVTFLKRKGGLFKKAHELAVLCSVDVAVIIFGHNKKLYEFSSSDMHDTLNRYQYCGPPHEHKGPQDFSGKRDADDDDDDETTPAPEDVPSRSRTHSAVPPSIQSQPGFQHINQAPSASPPVTNGMAFAPHRSTPQPHAPQPQAPPQVLSRPTSRNHLRRVSSNLAPHQHRATPPPQNGFAYLPNNPPMYMSQPPPRPGQYPHFTHPPPVSHHLQPAPQLHPPPPHPTHQPMQHSPMLQPVIPPRQQTATPHHIPPHAPPTHGLPQLSLSQPHAPLPQMTPVYLPDQARASVPPAFSAPPPPPPPQPRAVPVSTDSSSPPDQIPVAVKMEEGQPSKSRSIFTPIDDRGSVLARHFGVGPPPVSMSPRTDSIVRPESAPAQDESNAAKSSSSSSTSTAAPPNAVTAPTRAQTIPAGSDVKPPLRTNSGPTAGRPKLTVQIPSEASDRGSATADSSARDSAGHESHTPAKGSSSKNNDNNQPPTENQSGIVLPPPSPSAGAILSAGAQGPPNPFARPAPPGTTTVQSTNNNAHANNNNIETPISALPSRFVSDALLPSPSSFFPEWGFGRTGPDSNMLPSPLTFPTPSGATGPSFSREDEADRKRKNEEAGSSQEAASKRVKT